MAFAVVGCVVNDCPGFEFQPGHHFRRDLILIDHRAVDAIDFFVVVGVGDVRQHRAPYDDRQSELVINVHRADGHRRAIMRDTGDDGFIGRGFGSDLYADVGLAFVIEREHFIVVFRFRIGIAQTNGEIGGISPAQTVCRQAAGERADECNFNRIFRTDARNTHDRGQT